VGDFPMTTGAIPGVDGTSVDALTLRGLDTKRLASEVEIEFEIPVSRRAKKIQRLAQIAVRVELISIADQIALRNDTIDRGSDHQERTVKLPAVEGDEARVVVEPLPELLQNLLL